MKDLNMNRICQVICRGSRIWNWNGKIHLTVKVIKHSSGEGQQYSCHIRAFEEIFLWRERVRNFMPTFLHMLRVCRKECYSQTEIDYLFSSIVLPNITCGLSVSGASDAEINVLQQFLDRCYKLHFISTQLILDHYYKNKIKRFFKKLSSITGKNNGLPFLDIFRLFKEYPWKSQIW